MTLKDYLSKNWDKVAVNLMVTGIIALAGVGLYDKFNGRSSMFEPKSNEQKILECVEDSNVNVYVNSTFRESIDQLFLLTGYEDRVKVIECQGKDFYCASEGIVRYPTWIFDNDRKVESLLYVTQVIRHTGCDKSVQ
jgi:hypothetical protein